jgi:hypothetical protein
VLHWWVDGFLLRTYSGRSIGGSAPSRYTRCCPGPRCASEDPGSATGLVLTFAQGDEFGGEVEEPADGALVVSVAVTQVAGVPAVRGELPLHVAEPFMETAVLRIFEAIGTQA